MGQLRSASIGTPEAYLNRRGLWRSDAILIVDHAVFIGSIDSPRKSILRTDQGPLLLSECWAARH